jgi:predicted TIM-barrel fold metal-dependent hydrolase
LITLRDSGEEDAVDRTISSMADYRRPRVSRSRAVNEQLDVPVIDTDLHAIEFMPALEDFIATTGGPKVVDRVRKMISKGYFAANDWENQSPEDRVRTATIKPAFWGMPARNTLDLVTVAVPALLHERLAEQGTDFAVLFPNISCMANMIRVDEIRQPLVRACNMYNAEIYAPYADRMTAVATIPMWHPSEAVDELDYAVNRLGLKVALLSAGVRRPIESIAEKYPPKEHPEVAAHATWLDTFTINSAYDYDPVWAKLVELGVPASIHTLGEGWTARRSTGSYIFNHIGAFADASHTFAKALFLGGVTRRFPKLRVAMLEGGASCGAQLYCDLVAHWEKRGDHAIHNYDPGAVNESLIVEAVEAYGAELLAGRELSREEVLNGVTAVCSFHLKIPESELHEFAAAGVEKVEDIRDRFVPNFFFGSEADDRTAAYAFATKVNPLGAKIRALWASDSGHWDVPDLRETLAETWSLVEDGTIAESDFKDMVFANPYSLCTEANPDFFRGTAVAAKLGRGLAA